MKLRLAIEPETLLGQELRILLTRQKMVDHVSAFFLPFKQSKSNSPFPWTLTYFFIRCFREMLSLGRRIAIVSRNVGGQTYEEVPSKIRKRAIDKNDQCQASWELMLWTVSSDVMVVQDVYHSAPFRLNLCTRNLILALSFPCLRWHLLVCFTIPGKNDYYFS